MGKHTVTSFSYPIAELETVEEAERLAKADGASLSQLILRLLKEEIKQKKAYGDQTPIRISYGKQQEKPFQTDLTPWLERVNTIESQKELLILKGQGTTLMKRVDQRSKELYLQGIRL